MSRSGFMRGHRSGKPAVPPLNSFRLAVPYRPEPRPIPVRLAAAGTCAGGLALGAAAGMAGAAGDPAALVGVGAALGLIAGTLFRQAGARPRRTLSGTAFAAPTTALAAMCLASTASVEAMPALTLLASGGFAIPACTTAATRGGLFDDLARRWFRAPTAVAYLHPIGRPLVPRDLRMLEPYSGDKPMVLVVLHHPSCRTDGTEVISIELRRRRAPGLLARLRPFLMGSETVLPPTIITRDDLELLKHHPGTLDD